MARNTQAPEVERLIARLEQSREQVRRHADGLRECLDVPGRLRKSLRSHPVAWFGGSLGAGMIASRLLRRPRARKARRGWFGPLLGAAFTLSRPLLQQMITSEVQRRFHGRDPAAAGSGRRLAGPASRPAGAPDPGSGN